MNHRTCPTSKGTTNMSTDVTAGGGSSHAYVDGLTEEVCRQLLSSHHVGRVAFVDEDGFPVVLPVNYVVDGDDIVLRTSANETYERAPLHRVAFEVDEFHEETQTGWSLLVRGAARDATASLAEAFEVGLHRTPHTWAPGEKNQIIAIAIERISGRQIVRTTG